jgi:diguanylate cyclase (GGDEF)-like protein
MTIATGRAVRWSTLYALLGVLAGLLAPAGMFTYILVAGRTLEPLELFLATAFGGMVTLGAAGWMIGRREDVLQRRNEELANLSGRLQALSVTDALTGIPNRRAFDERLAGEVARSNRYHTSLTLVMLDLDHFKQLNDRYGHVAGDAVLRAVAVLLDREKRAGDMVARFGGEELAAILPHTDARAALIWAERLRLQIASLRVPVPERPYADHLWITASFGLAEAAGAGEQPRRLVDEADRALYRAKRHGRNVVAWQLARARSAG